MVCRGERVACCMSTQGQKSHRIPTTESYKYTLLTMTASVPAAQAMGDPMPEIQTKLCRKRHERPTCDSTTMSKAKAVAESGADASFTRRTGKSQCSIFYHLLTTFLPKLILEVMGGAGAIWGFSEACGLRRPETVYFWRPAALAVGGLFFLRFLKQLFEEMTELRSSSSPSSSSLIPASPSCCDLELGKNDLELTCTDSSTTDSPTSNHITTAPSSNGQPLPLTELTAIAAPSHDAHRPQSLLVPSLGTRE